MEMNKQQQHMPGPQVVVGQQPQYGAGQEQPMTIEQVTHQPAPNDYLVCSILSCICCCPLLGIVAIVYATKTRDAFQQGFINKSQEYSKTTLHWIIATVVIGIIGIIAFSVVRAYA